MTTGTAQVGGESIGIETGKLASRPTARWSCARGDSMVLVTAVSAKEKREGLDFFPLTVDYQERVGRGPHPRQLLRPRGPPHRARDAGCA